MASASQRKKAAALFQSLSFGKEAQAIRNGALPPLNLLLRALYDKLPNEEKGIFGLDVLHEQELAREKAKAFENVPAAFCALIKRKRLCADKEDWPIVVVADQMATANKLALRAWSVILVDANATIVPEIILLDRAIFVIVDSLTTNFSMKKILATEAKWPSKYIAVRLHEDHEPIFPDLNIRQVCLGTLCPPRGEFDDDILNGWHTTPQEFMLCVMHWRCPKLAAKFPLHMAKWLNQILRLQTSPCLLRWLRTQHPAVLYAVLHPELGDAVFQTERTAFENSHEGHAWDQNPLDPDEDAIWMREWVFHENQSLAEWDGVRLPDETYLAGQHLSTYFRGLPHLVAAAQDTKMIKVPNCGGTRDAPDHVPAPLKTLTIHEAHSRAAQGGSATIAEYHGLLQMISKPK